MREILYEQDLVRALLREQHPDLADLEIRNVPGGWGNQQFRLGDDLAVRMPRYGIAPQQLRVEQRWTASLAERLPLPIPATVRVGEPSELFEHPWSVVRWVQGEPGDSAPITRAQSAEVLGEFLAALHEPASGEALAPSPRQVEGEEELEEWLAQALLDDERTADAVRAVWREAVAAPRHDGAPVWLHTDLHPANVVVRDGMLAGVIDFGDMGTGDPAIDLSAAFILLPAAAVGRFFEAYQRADEAAVARARGWAALRALTLIAIGRAGRLGKPGGKPTWEPAGFAALERALTT